MTERKSWLGRGCLVLALVAVTPFLAVAIIAVAGIALGAFTVSLPFLFLLALIALAVAAVSLLVMFVVRGAIGRRGQEKALEDFPA